MVQQAQTIPKTEAKTPVPDQNVFYDDEADTYQCVIHVNSKIAKNELKTFKVFTPKTLEKCKFISCVRKKLSLKYNLIFIPDNSSNFYGYHSSCYRLYTAVKQTAIEKYNNLPEEMPSKSHDSQNVLSTESSKDGEPGSERMMTRKSLVIPLKSKTTGVFKSVCLFCNKKYFLHNKKNYGLISAATQKIQNSILSCIKILDDKVLLTKVGNADFIAKEIKYHQICRTLYNNKAIKKYNKNRVKKTSNYTKMRITHKKVLSV